ncbi:MAG: ABC transporter ATP-binding protein [Actinomycetes bacterium]
MPSAAVEVDNLVKTYGQVRAVDGLSFTARRGAVTAVLGPNGAGKTTTVETCAGFRRADGGTVRVLGLDPHADAARLRPAVGVMLQSGGVPPGARPVEVLRLAASLYAHPLDPAVLVDALGLGEAAGTPYRRMSGGQQRRLAFALALVGRPELVFCDEPTAGLDPHGRLAMHGLVERLRDDGVSIVLTTHLMDEAERLADHVVIVDSGRVVAAGDPDSLTAGHGAEVVRFRGPAGRDTSGLAASLPAGCRVLEPTPSAYRVERDAGGPLGPQVLAAVTAWCARQGFMPGGLDVGRRTLEDVFLEVTGRDRR